MNASSEFDVAVVGAGPAGTTAACLLQRAGHRVVLIDRCTFPREKLCGGCLSKKTLGIIRRIYGDTRESLLEKGVIDYISGDYTIYLNNDEICAGVTDDPFCFVKRERYDSYLLGIARDAGVDVIEGQEVISINPDNNTLLTSSGRELRAEYIVGADGVHSRVRKYFPESHFRKEDWHQNLAMALEIRVRREGLRELADAGECPSFLNENLRASHVFIDTARWGYDWIFPNTDEIIIGICGLEQRNEKSLTDEFQEFLSRLGLTEASSGISGYPLPYGNYLRDPVYRNLILIGDAGGFADPILGEGLYFAHRTAEFAASAIHRSLTCGEDPGKIYRELLERYMLSEMDHEMRIRDVIFTAHERHLRMLVKILLSSMSRYFIEAVHGERSFGFFRRIYENGSSVDL